MSVQKRDSDGEESSSSPITVSDRNDSDNGEAHLEGPKGTPGRCNTEVILTDCAEIRNQRDMSKSERNEESEHL
jgi:hypothetical protein